MRTQSFIAAGVRLILAPAILLGICSCTTTEPALTALSAQAPPAVPASQPVWYYLSADAIDVDALMLAPPDAIAPQIRDFENRLTSQIKSHASAAEQAHARADETDTIWKFASVMGPAFTHDNCPKIEQLLNRAALDGNRIKNTAKDRFARQRPAAAGPAAAVAPGTATRPEDWSYPGGHATRAAMRSRLLAAIAPDREIDLQREAWSMCLSRMILGVHFPSDITAGFVLGEALADAILKSPNAAADLEAAKQEWALLSAAPAAH